MNRNHAGLLIIASGLFVPSRLTHDASYWTQVLPILLLLGMGTDSVQPASNSAATYQAGAASGAAGAVASTAQQVGSSLGMALLGSVAAATTASVVNSGVPNPQAAGIAVTEGFAAAGLTGAIILAVAALGVFLLAGRPQ